jgi:pilus assembly protein Flp/PilA
MEKQMNQDRIDAKKAKAQRERGATMVEYALLVALVAVVVAAALPAFTGSINGVFTRVGAQLDGVAQN